MTPWAKIPKNKPKRIQAICKYFAHNIKCPFEKTQGSCKHVHCDIIKEAVTYAKGQRFKNEKVLGTKIKEILSKDITEETDNPLALIE